MISAMLSSPYAHFVRAIKVLNLPCNASYNFADLKERTQNGLIVLHASFSEIFFFLSYSYQT